MKSKKVYTIDEIQNILGISKASTYKLVNSNVFHYVKIGNLYRISKISFDNWLENQGGNE